MPRKRNGKADKPLQETSPQYEDGAEGPPVMIPVPKRDDVLSALRKVARPSRRKPSE